MLSAVSANLVVCLLTVYYLVVVFVSVLTNIPFMTLGAVVYIDVVTLDLTYVLVLAVVVGNPIAIIIAAIPAVIFFIILCFFICLTYKIPSCVARLLVF